MAALEDLHGIHPTPIWEGVVVRAVHGERCTLGVVELAPDAVVPRHQHDNEQLGLVISGNLVFTVGDETRELGPGGTWRIASDVPHHVVAGPAGAVVIDVFAPHRADWKATEPTPICAPVWPTT
jgi:quercetin dioxygenase-like cupin family protein